VRILFVHTFYKLPGGEDSVVQNEISLLRENGHKVELLSFSNAGSMLNLLFMPYNPFSYRKTKTALNSFKPEIVHLHNLHFAGSASVIRAIHQEKIPMVMTLHNYRLLCPSASLYHEKALFLDSLTSNFPWTAIKKGVYQNSVIITFWLAFSNYIHRKLGTWQMVNKFIFLSSHSKQLFQSSTFKTAEIKTAIKPNFTKASKSQKQPFSNTYFLYVGRLTEEKGVITLLEAFEGSGLWLKIAGIGPLQSLVDQYAKDNTNIEYLGQQTREEIDLLLDKAEAVIFPSKWYETFGMIVIEAFAKGVPVIASDLGNMSILVSDTINGRIFKPGDAHDLRLKALEMANMLTAEKKLMSVNAKASFEQNYSPEANLKILVEIYQSTIQSYKAS
jgi:glycosyltransferase involved in cell wall biosynthesis